MLLKKLLAINRDEFPWSINPYITRYSYINQQFNLRKLIDKEEEILVNMINNARCFVIRSANKKDFVDLLRNILKDL